jgi:16S rRNA (adenine1518-N6/adenine1519-N6)-dimethyltransferase
VNLTDTTKYLQENNFVPSKKMGQNFLTNEQIVNHLLTKIDLKNVDCILEIGPGLGALTDNLIKTNIQLIICELDKRLTSFLRSRYDGIKHITIINDDVLNLNFDQMLAKFQNPIIISNLPYSISSPALIKFLKSSKPQQFVCMLQKEMVNRILAKPDAPEYNGFTVLLNTYCDIQLLMNVSANNFYPVPAVGSAIIQLSKNSKAFDQKYESFIKLCFASKRKTLINNLKSHYPALKIQQAFDTQKLDYRIRAEAISTSMLEIIYSYLSQ